MIKVAILTDYIPPYKMGGLGVLALNLHEYYRNNIEDIKSTLITTGNLKSERNGVISLAEKINSAYFLNSLRKLPTLLNNFDVIHVHQCANSLLLARCIARRGAPKIIATFHSSKIAEANRIKKIEIGEYIFRPSIDEYLNRYFFKKIHIISDLALIKKAELITSVSQKTREEISHDYNVEKDNINIVYNGVDTNHFSPLSKVSNIKEKFNLSNKLLILSIVPSKIAKGFFGLLYCFKNIVDFVPNAKLVIIGSIKKDKKYAASINDFICENKLEDYILFADKVLPQRMPNFYSAADLVVIPSLYENLPLVLLEAMSMSKVVICTDVGGVNEVVKTNENGIIVKANDQKALEEKIIFLLKNCNIRQKIGKNARKTIINNFTLKNCAEKYAEIYRQLT
jgi:glycosyltransferase involved in cell wall biosynthesis